MQRYLSLLALLLLPAAALSQAGCGSDAQSKSPEEPEAKTVIPVEAAAVTRGSISAFFTGTATLEAEEEAAVVAKVGGGVEELFVEAGDYVREGQPLARLDDERLALEVARAEANLQQLQRAHERNEELYAKQLVSAEEYERVRSEYETQKAATDLARLELAYTVIRAPISGVVSARHIKRGNMVRLNDPAFEITDFDPLLAVLHVPERELAKLGTGQEAELQLDALPLQRFRGRVKRISPVVDPATGTSEVTVEVRGASDLLKPGMFGRTQITYDTREEALLVPKEAVLLEDDAASVYVIRDSMAFRQAVRTGYTDALSIEVLDGLAEGDPVITTGQSGLRDSTLVEVID